MLGEAGEGFKYAQVRLSPARLSHCMRWLGACIRAHEIATDYANRREAFGKPLIDHEGVGFMLAENRILIKQCELMIDWCASVLDTGSLGTVVLANLREAGFRGPLHLVNPRHREIFAHRIIAKLAIADDLARPLAQLAPDDRAFINQVLAETLVRPVVLARVRAYFRHQHTQGHHHAG